MSALDDLVQQCGFDKIDAITKYPSVLSYHRIKNNGVLNELNELPDNYQPLPTHPEKIDIIIQEKIEGQIGRIIVYDNDFFIGTDEIIYAKGDRISSSPVIAPVIEALNRFISTNQGSLERVFVLYGVAYGQQLPGGERYTQEGRRGFRAFDGFSIPMQDVLALSRNSTAEQLVDWVNNLQQSFFSISTLNRFCDTFNIPQVPVLFEGTLDQVPTDTKEVSQWLKQFKTSQAILDNIKEEINEQPIVTDKIDINDFFNENNNENKIITSRVNKPKTLYKQSAGLILRTPTRTYVRSIVFDNYNNLHPETKNNSAIPNNSVINNVTQINGFSSNLNKNKQNSQEPAIDPLINNSMNYDNIPVSQQSVKNNLFDNNINSNTAFSRDNLFNRINTVRKDNLINENINQFKQDANLSSTQNNMFQDNVLSGTNIRRSSTGFNHIHRAAKSNQMQNIKNNEQSIKATDKNINIHSANANRSFNNENISNKENDFDTVEFD